MVSGWRYRIAAIAGVSALTVLAVVLGNDPAVQRSLRWVPLYGRFWTRSLGPARFPTGLATVLLVVGGSLWPLYKPRPRRILDVISLTQQRTLLALVLLAAVGYFDWTFRLPRPMLVVTTAVLLVALPAWFLTISQRVSDEERRSLVVGDDPEAIRAILETLDRPVLGYVAPNSAYVAEETPPGRTVQYADGGQPLGAAALQDLPCLGGLSKLEDVLVAHDVDTVALAFERSDRHVFFGVLDVCNRHGVTARAHREHADSVLVQGGASADDLVAVDLAPWDWQDHVVKRAFDVAFAAVALVALAPAALAIAVAVKLDGAGPVLYAQERTAIFGEPFTVYKFRTMAPGSADARPAGDADLDGITRVGRVLRATHLDELPQLWTVLAGTMSVVGPRAAWTDEETRLEARTGRWRKRWFVKPGLTGLAQIQGVESTDPARKLRYDVEYIRRQSFWFDVQIVIRQLWAVAVDTVAIVRARRS